MTQEMKDKVIEMALQGYTSKEISSTMPGISDDVISSYIISYHKSEDKEKQDIYDRILIARNLRNKEIIDYDVVEEMIEFVEQGFTFLEIGLLYEKTENEIRDLLYKVLYEKRSIYQDQDLYQRIMQKQNNTVKNKFQDVYYRVQKLKENGLELKSLESSDLVHRLQRYQAMIDLVQEYIDYNGTISAQALATKYQMKVTAVRSLLNGSLHREITLPMLGEEKMKEIKEQSIQYGKEMIDKDGRLFDHITRAEKDLLEKIENNKKTWIQMMLTFRLSVKDVAILNNFPTNKLYALKNVLCNHNSKMEQNALDYLLDYYIPNIHPDTTQERKNAITFQNTLSMLRTRNTVAYKAYVGRLSDVGYKNVATKKINEYTFDDYMVVIDYLLKYALYPEEVGLTKELLKDYANGERRNELEILWQYQERKQEDFLKK